MAKKNQNTKSRLVVKCKCNICGQIANAQSGTAHIYCKGMPLDMLARMPDKFKNITNPQRAALAKWELYVAPIPQEEAPIVQGATA